MTVPLREPYRVRAGHYLQRVVGELPLIDGEASQMIELEQALINRTHPAPSGERAVWFATLHAFEEFIARNIRMPSRFASNPSEVALALWFASERMTRRSAFQDARIARYVERQEGLVGPWWTTYAAVESFVIMAGRLPKRDARCVDERRLGLWLVKERSAKKRKRQAAKRLARYILDLFRAQHPSSDGATLDAALRHAGHSKLLQAKGGTSRDGED